MSLRVDLERLFNQYARLSLWGSTKVTPRAAPEDMRPPEGPTKGQTAVERRIQSSEATSFAQDTSNDVESFILSTEAESHSDSVTQIISAEAANFVHNASESFILSTDVDAFVDLIEEDKNEVDGDLLLALCSNFIKALLKYFIGSVKHRHESYKIWKNPRLSLVSQPVADLIEKGKSIRFCRDRFFEMTSHPNDGDRIKSLSLTFHYRLMFLTHSYVIGVFYCVWTLNFFILVALFVITTNEAQQPVGLMLVMVIALPAPLLVSRIITHKWRGKVYSKFPWVQCLLTVVSVFPLMIQNDHVSDENTFLRNVKFIENSSIYELINSVINFALWKKHSILMIDNEFPVGSEDKPFEELESSNMYLWKKIETISLLSSRVFFWLIELVPRGSVAFGYGFLIFNVVMGFLGTVSVGKLPIYGINGNSSEVAGSPIWIIMDFIFCLLTIYLLVALSVAFSMFRLSFHIHHFQITTFKQRLLMDRLRTRRVNTNMKHLLKFTQHNKGLNRRVSSIAEQTQALGTKPMQWLDCRDLHEEYLYHQSVVNRSAQNWQLVAAVSFVLGISFFAVSLVALIIAQNFYFFIGGVYLMLVLLFIVLRVAVLNAELDSIIGILKSAASSDWSLYGGRDQLLKDFSLNPISFKMYGVEITFAWLITMVTAFVTANLSVFMFIYSSSLSSFEKM